MSPRILDELTTSSFVLDNSVHVWDVRRPHIPVVSFEGLIDVASAILWVKDSPFGESRPTSSEGYGRLLCCSKVRLIKSSSQRKSSLYPFYLQSINSSELTLHSYKLARQPIHTMCAVGVSIAPNGDVAYVTDKVDRDSPLIPPVWKYIYRIH